jgi:peroxisomal membrane protein 4
MFGSQIIQLPNSNAKEFKSINRQLAYYLFSRVVEGIFLKFQKLDIIRNFEGFPISYLLSWGMVMYLFELDKDILNRSLTVSMDYIYKESDKDLKSWRELVPFDIPEFILKKNEE